MALIDPSFSNDSPLQFWEDELNNARRLLYEIEKAILYFTQEALSSGGVQEYTIDTGQDRQTVKRLGFMRPITRYLIIKSSLPLENFKIRCGLKRCFAETVLLFPELTDKQVCLVGIGLTAMPL